MLCCLLHCYVVGYIVGYIVTLLVTLPHCYIFSYIVSYTVALLVTLLHCLLHCYINSYITTLFVALFIVALLCCWLHCYVVGYIVCRLDCERAYTASKATVIQVSEIWLVLFTATYKGQPDQKACIHIAILHFLHVWINKFTENDGQRQLSLTLDFYVTT